MARRQQPQPSGFVLFDIIYEDGSQTSNRKVPATELGGLDGDAPARTFVEIQDRKIGERRDAQLDRIAERDRPGGAARGHAPDAGGRVLESSRGPALPRRPDFRNSSQYGPRFRAFRSFAGVCNCGNWTARRVHC